MSSLNKVIIRNRQGKIIAGFAEENNIRGQIKILTRQGKEQVLGLEDIKAIFFVKDFQGNPQHEELKFLTKQPVSQKVWIRLVLCDGEMLEGKVKNNSELLDPQGLYLWPSDPDTNNRFAYIPRSAIKELTILGID